MRQRYFLNKTTTFSERAPLESVKNRPTLKFYDISLSSSASSACPNVIWPTFPQSSSTARHPRGTDSGLSLHPARVTRPDGTNSLPRSLGGEILSSSSSEDDAQKRLHFARQVILRVQNNPLHGSSLPHSNRTSTSSEKPRRCIPKLDFNGEQVRCSAK